MSTEEKWQKYVLVLLIKLHDSSARYSTLEKRVLSKSTVCPNFNWDKFLSPFSAYRIYATKILGSLISVPNMAVWKIDLHN